MPFEPGARPALRARDPRRVGDWSILRRLGSGGMGVVYLGERDCDGRLGAVKVIADAMLDDPTFLARFSREVEALRRVSGPHVAAMLDADVAGESSYLVTEYIAGRALQAVVDCDGPLGAGAWWAIARGLLVALTRVHAAGIVHRDLKPTNVIVAGGQPWLIDFGMAALLDASSMTASRALLGTLGWMAPERLRGGQATPASDLFSLGAVLAHCGTGRPPFGADGPVTTLTRVLAGDSDVVGLAPDRAALVRALLSDDPTARPTARDALLALPR